MRLQKYMAQAGAGSRRKCEELIRQGRVSVNGKQITEMGVQVDPEKDHIVLDGREILNIVEEMHYILYYKPQGTISAVTDPYGRRTVLESMGWTGTRIYPVGRLDLDTEGLLLLTNDGSFAYEMTHPKHEVEKEYFCKVIGQPHTKDLNRLEQGVDIGGFVTSPAKLQSIRETKEYAAIRLVIHEGKNRQVRRMFAAIGHPVVFLRRDRMGNLTLGSLKPGEWRNLTKSEIENLLRASGGNSKNG